MGIDPLQLSLAVESCCKVACNKACYLTVYCGNIQNPWKKRLRGMTSFIKVPFHPLPPVVKVLRTRAQCCNRSEVVDIGLPVYNLVHYHQFRHKDKINNGTG